MTPEPDVRRARGGTRARADRYRIDDGRQRTTGARPGTTDTAARRPPPAGRMMVTTDGRDGVRVDVLTAADLLAAEGLAELADRIREALRGPEPLTPRRVAGRRAA